MGACVGPGTLVILPACPRGWRPYLFSSLLMQRVGVVLCSVWCLQSFPSAVHLLGFSPGSVVKTPPVMQRCKFDPWVGKIPWRRAWPPAPVFLPGKSHGQRSLAGYSPWGCKESDRTERLSVHTCPLLPRVPLCPSSLLPMVHGQGQTQREKQNRNKIWINTLCCEMSFFLIAPPKCFCPYHHT